MNRKATSPQIATLVMVTIGMISALLLLNSGTVGSQDPRPSQGLEFITAYQENPVCVENAGWQIALKLSNQGKWEERVSDIFINQEHVDEYSLKFGERLRSNQSIGTSIPKSGMTIPPGVIVTVHIWIGEDLFEEGTHLDITLNYPNHQIFRKTVTLN
jgi:hypothetical protein